MKTLSSLIALLSLTISVSAGGKCERLALYDMSNLNASFERDLVSNAWNTSILGTYSTLYFRDDGSAIAVSASLENVETYTWGLFVDECGTSLRFFGSMGEKRFTISPTCNGISASANGKVIQMLVSNDHRKSEVELNFLRDQMIGTWTYQRAEKVKKSHPAQFSLSLNPDGTFRLKPAPDNVHSAQTGIWQLSVDSKYLILHTRIYVGNKERYVPEAISIRSVDFEDMVIGAQTLPRTLAAYESRNLLYLSKVPNTTTLNVKH